MTTDLETAARAALEALKKARQDTESWAAYADGYFKQKWDLKGDLARQDKAIAALEAALAAPSVDWPKTTDWTRPDEAIDIAAIRRAALEEAARVVDARAALALWTEHQALRLTAAAIRALAEKEQTDD